MNPSNLILGGSHGIGFGYAYWCAKKNEELVLIGRDERDLRVAHDRLIEAGASNVEVVSGDLLESSFRSILFRRFSERKFRSVLIGGPSPPAGMLHDLSPADYSAACRIVLVYPLTIVEWADKHLDEHGTVFL